MTITAAYPYKESVINLLSVNKLPTTDLPGNLADFYVYLDEDTVKGVVGLEVYGNYGLLRSLAVDPSARSNGLAASLLTWIEETASAKGLEDIYLLTETAVDYFDKHGYEHIARMDVPEEIKLSSQFMGICPETATAMKKTLGD
jgi:amino-acid N-acetyltransferase